MTLISPLAALVATLAEVCKQAKQHQTLLCKNESATRVALIDPILRALGWDTSDMALVEPERTVQNKQSLDYLLKTRDGGVLAVIEAKKLGEALDKIGHVGALIGYAFSLKPTLFFITDGLHWHCYSPNHSQYEPVVTFALSESTLTAAAIHLLQFLDALHGGHGSPNGAMKTVGKSSEVSNSVPTKTPKFVQQKSIDQATNTINSQEFIELAYLNTLTLQPGQKPIKLRLPNGAIKSIHKWKDILFELANFLLLHNKNVSLPLPDKAGKKRFLLTSEKPSTGSSTPSSYKGKNVFIYTHYSATDCIANALYAEAHIPADVCKVKAAVAF